MPPESALPDTALAGVRTTPSPGGPLAEPVGAADAA